MNLKQTLKFSFKRQRTFFLIILIYMLVLYIASMPAAYSGAGFGTTFSLHAFAVIPIFFYIVVSAKDLIFSAIANGVSRKTAITANICVWLVFAVVLSCVCTLSETALSSCFKKYTKSSPIYNGTYVNDFENDIKYYAVFYTDGGHKEKTEISEREYNLYRCSPEVHRSVDKRCGQEAKLARYVPFVPPTLRTVLLSILYTSFEFMLAFVFAWFAGVLEIIVSYSGYGNAVSLAFVGLFVLGTFLTVFIQGYIENNLFVGKAFVTFAAAVVTTVYDFKSFIYGNFVFALLWQLVLSVFWAALAFGIRKFIRASHTKRNG